MLANFVSGNSVATLSIAAAAKKPNEMTRSYFCRARSDELGRGLLRGRRQHPPSDPQLSDGPLEPEVGPMEIRALDACRLDDEPEPPFSHQEWSTVSTPRRPRCSCPGKGRPSALRRIPGTRVLRPLQAHLVRGRITGQSCRVARLVTSAPLSSRGAQLLNSSCARLVAAVKEHSCTLGHPNSASFARRFVLPCRAGTTPGRTDTRTGPMASLLTSRSTSGLPVMLTGHWSSLQLAMGASRSRLLSQRAGA